MCNNTLTSHEYSIQEVSRLTGLPESTLRYYETIGLIEPIERDESSKHRRYSESDLDLITSIACLNATGMSLESMRAYIENRGTGASESSKQIELLTVQMKHLRNEERLLQVRQQYVSLKIKYWHAVKAGEKAKAQAISKKASVLAKELIHNK